MDIQQQQQEQQQQPQPPWLCDLLGAEFECIKGKKRQNSFCITCTRNAISKKEGERHQGMGHTVIEVMKCSGYYSLKAADIERLSLDSSDIHEFIINHKNVIFLNSRQHRDRIIKKRNDGTCCIVCGWTLDAGLFCSLGCKFSNEGKVSSMEHEDSGNGEIGTHIPIPTTMGSDHGGVIGIQIPIPKRPRTKRIRSQSAAVISFRKRSRKRKPMRSPLS